MKTKKKILFALQTMVMGGVEQELIMVLNRLSPSDYDVTILVFYIQDETMIRKLPPHIKVVNLNIDHPYYCSSTLRMIYLRLKRGKWHEAGMLTFKKLFRLGLPGANTNIRAIQAPAIEYDTAICYHIHSPLTVRYVAEKIHAVKKLAWIHNDFDTTGFRADKLLFYFSQYNQIIAVSDKIGAEFKTLCPELSPKVKTIHNVLNTEEVRQKANETFPDSFFSDSKLRLLTVGRLEEQKGFDLAIAVAELLKQRGIEFSWYFIGAGSKETELRQLILQKKLNADVFLLGRKDNPYPYMKQCDIYVQPSRHEGFCLTVIEAKILEKPIVCTDFAGCREQLQDHVNGIIVPTGIPCKLADGITELIQNKKLREVLSSSLSQQKVNDDESFAEIMQCLN